MKCLDGKYTKHSEACYQHTQVATQLKLINEKWLFILDDESEVLFTSKVTNRDDVLLYPCEPYPKAWMYPDGTTHSQIRLIDYSDLSIPVHSGLSRKEMHKVLGRLLTWSEKRPFLLAEWNQECKDRQRRGMRVPTVDLDDDGSIKAAHEVLVKLVYKPTKADAEFFEIYPNNTILDLGAHRGYFTWFAFDAAVQKSSTETHGLRIVAFEPAVTNFAHLQTNAAALGDFVEIRREAVAHESGELMFAENLKSSWNSCLELHTRKKPKRGDDDECHTYKVHVSALADVLLELKPDVVKIDTEGTDVDMLLKTHPSCWACVQVLFVEYSIARELRAGADALLQSGHLVDRKAVVEHAVKRFCSVLDALESAGFIHVDLPSEIFTSSRWSLSHIRSGYDFVFMASKRPSNASPRDHLTRWKTFRREIFIETAIVLRQELEL